MKPTLINQTVAQQSIMYRLDYLASQLPSKDMAIALGRQTGKATPPLAVVFLCPKFGWQARHPYKVRIKACQRLNCYQAIASGETCFLTVALRHG